MGTNMPSGNQAALAWLEGHITQWGANQAAIGLASAAVIDLATNLANERSAWTTIEGVRADSKTKTQSFNLNMKAVRTQASDMIATIKAYAAASGNATTVYDLAGLTQADPRQPATPPETPLITSSVLDGLGNVTIEWTGRGPTGTVYNVSRLLPGGTSFVFLGQGDGRNKTFKDTSVPSGTPTAEYSVTAVRGSDTSAPSPTTTVRFFSEPAEGESEAA